MTAVAQYEANVNGAALVEQPTPGPQGDDRSVDKSQNTPERKWRMTRLKAGDYLLPSNDRSTVFRIGTYTEWESVDDTTEREYECWGAWRWLKPLAALTADPGYSYDPLDDYDTGWQQIAHYCKTRQEAIDAALRWEWEQANPLHDRPRRKPLNMAEIFGRQA